MTSITTKLKTDRLSLSSSCSESNPLVSIIVPVYNVAEYLSSCVQSLLNQSYKNIEILLIDDGSTDDSGAICDLYSSNSIVKVFHKENGGLSDARNYGIDRSSGDFLTFVDSDDYVSAEYIQSLLSLLKVTDSDISVCQMKMVQDVSEYLTGDDFDTVATMSGLDAIKQMFYNRKISISACAKLYKKELFKNIRYPVGYYFEDVGTTYKPFLKSPRIAVSDSCLYFYVMRSNSITHERITDYSFDRCCLAKEAYRYFVQNEPGVACAARCFYARNIMAVLRLSDSDDTAFASKLYGLEEELKSLRESIFIDAEAPIKDKLGLVASLFGRRFLSSTWRMYSFFRGSSAR